MSTKAKKGLKVTLIVIAAILVVLAAVVYFMFGKEIASVASVEHKAEYGDLYVMDYTADYDMAAFLEVGAENDSELVEYIISKLLKGLPLEIEVPTIGCSTFSATTEEGTPIFGRNYDLDETPGLLVKTDPEDGYASISMVDLGFLGYTPEYVPDSMANSILTLAAAFTPLDGVNEAGVAIGVMLIDTEPTHQYTDKIDITTTTAIRMILDYAATTQEAIDMLGQYDMHASAGNDYHFMITDKSGHTVVVEYIENEMSVVESDISTNFLLTEGEWYSFGMGHDRYEILEAAMEETGGVMTREYAMELLEAVSQDNVRPDGTTSGTQWSALYDLEAGTMEIVMDRAFGTAYTDSIG